MKLGEKILKLRKENGLSQEQLGEKVEVTRQTISNWELGETSPNPTQLKMLSKALHISIDELLDNEIKSVLEEKVSNTEKLAGLIIKIVKGIGIALVILLVIDVLAFLLFAVPKRGTIEESTIESIEVDCSIDNKEYKISVGTDGYFNCSNCSNDLQKELKENYTDFDDMTKTEENINDYFKNNHGMCE